MISDPNDFNMIQDVYRSQSFICCLKANVITLPDGALHIVLPEQTLDTTFLYKGIMSLWSSRVWTAGELLRAGWIYSFVYRMLIIFICTSAPEKAQFPAVSD